MTWPIKNASKPITLKVISRKSIITLIYNKTYKPLIIDYSIYEHSNV